MKNNNSHLVANAYNQLIKMFKQLQEESGSIYLTLFPKIDGITWNGSKVEGEPLAITETFYHSIIKRMEKHKTNKIEILNKKENRLFVLIRIPQLTDDGQYFLIGITEIDDIIKV